jgi:hypothetical protein
MIYEYGEPLWDDTDRDNPKSSDKHQSQCHFVHHNPTWTVPSANPGLRGERPENNSLIHGTVYT